MSGGEQLRDYLPIEKVAQKLIEIYEQGLKEHNNVGCLGLTCSEETNKIDVFFMNEICVFVVSRKLIAFVKISDFN